MMSLYLPCGTKQMSWLSALSATARPSSRASARVSSLGSLAEREPQERELLGGRRVEEIALVPVGIGGAIERAAPVGAERGSAT